MSLLGMEGPFGGGMENMGRFGSGMNMGRINGKTPIYTYSLLAFGSQVTLGNRFIFSK